MLGKFQDSYKTDTEFPQDGLSVGFQATRLTADGNLKRYQTEASVEGKQDIFLTFRNSVDHWKAEFNSCTIPAPSIKAEEDIKQTGLNTRIIKTSVPFREDFCCCAEPSGWIWQLCPWQIWLANTSLISNAQDGHFRRQNEFKSQRDQNQNGHQGLPVIGTN